MAIKKYLEFSKKFRSALESRKYTLKKFSDETGIPVPTLGNYSRGANTPEGKYREIIAEKLGLSETDFHPDSIYFTESGRIVKPVKTHIFTGRRKVPVVSFALGGAFDVKTGHFEDLANQIEDEVETASRDPNAFAIEVQGDSMEPAIQHGDRVVLEPNAMPANGQVVLVRLTDDRVFLKRFYRTGPEGGIIRLKSENPNYKEFEVPVTDVRWVYPARDLHRSLK